MGIGKGFATGAAVLGVMAPLATACSDSIGLSDCEYQFLITGDDIEGDISDATVLSDTLALAERRALAGDLDEASDYFESVERQADRLKGDSPRGIWEYPAEAATRFQMSPEDYAKGVTASCEADAGRVEDAEATLESISNDSLRHWFEKRVENYEASEASNQAEEGDYDEAFEILDLIMPGTQRHVDARARVDSAIARNALHEAREGEYEDALETVELVEDGITRINSRDDIEAQIASAAIRLARQDDLSDASELAELIDEGGEVTQSIVLSDIDDALDPS